MRGVRKRGGLGLRWRWSDGARWRRWARKRWGACGLGGRGCRSRRWRMGGCDRLRFGFYHSGGCSLRHRRAALLAEFPGDIQRPFAETADHRSRLSNLPFKRLLQRFIVELRAMIAEAGAGRRCDPPGARRHHGSGSDFQRDRVRFLVRRSRHRGPRDRRRRPPRRNPNSRRPWGINARGRRRRGRRGRQRGSTLKAEAHPLLITRMAFGTSQHTFAANRNGFSAKSKEAYYYTLRHFTSLVRLRQKIAHGARGGEEYPHPAFGTPLPRGGRGGL